MAKRFTDTEKWKKQFFKNLTQRQMLFWNFINDDCDHSGAWYVDIEVAALRMKESIELTAMIEAFNNDETRVVLFDNGKKLMILSFCLFQYGPSPNPKNRLHTAAYKTLKAHGFEWFNGVITALERPMGKGKDMVKEKKKEGHREEKDEIPVLVANRDEVLNHDPDFDQLEAFKQLWAKYPVKGRLNESASMRIFFETVVNRDLESRIQKSLENYTAHLKANDWKQPQKLLNWLAEWPDWERHEEPQVLEDWQKKAIEERSKKT